MDRLRSVESTYVLLARALASLTREVEAEAGSETCSLAVWSNVLRCVAASGGLSEKDLPQAARISKRLATAAVTGSLRRGWITAEGPARARTLHLTASGEAAAQRWPRALSAVDEGWVSLRAPLERVVSQLPFELPHFPASYGTADPSATGGPFMYLRKKKDDLPAHGVDWRPVLRARDADTVSALPVAALLSQALMAYTIDYEDAFPWPLHNTATVLRHVTTEPKPLADLPPDHGITGGGKSLLERHLVVEVSAGPDRRKVVALTGRGETILRMHPDRVEQVEAAWRARFGEELVEDARAALAERAVDGPDHVMGTLHLG